MLLGNILNELRDETAAATALLSLGDIRLVAEVEAARKLHDEDVGVYVSGAAQRFARLASDEDWLRMMTALERSESPAATCLTNMVRWSIARDTAPATHPSDSPLFLRQWCRELPWQGVIQHHVISTAISFDLAILI